jgi:RNA polymerase sigma factor (sigma-70 family)
VSLSPPEPAHARAVEQTPDRWFAEEVHPHGPQLKSYLKGTFPSVRDIDDVVQESYLRIWKAKAAQPIHSAKAFLYKIARHLALDTIRKHGNSPLDSVGDPAVSRVIDSSPDAAEALISKETLHHLADAIADLPDRCREVVILHKLKGLTHKEVAAQLNLSDRTVEKHCYKGLKHCAAYLKARGITAFFE